MRAIALCRTGDSTGEAEFERILGLDSSVRETYGEQEGSAYNGCFSCTCYHPLFLFNQFGDLESAMLRNGNKACAKFWRKVLLPFIERYRRYDIPKFFRGDVAAGRRRLPIRHPHQVQRRAGAKNRAPTDATCGLSLAQADGLLSQLSVSSQIVTASASHDCQDRMARGKLFAHVGFIVTNLTKHSKNVVKLYNGGETVEQSIKEGQNAVKWTKLTCRAFKDNQTWLQLFALAYNLANFLRCLALPGEIGHWSLTTLRDKLVKIGAKATRRSKYVIFQLVEVAVTRKLFAAILDRMVRLALPPTDINGRMLA